MKARTCPGLHLHITLPLWSEVVHCTSHMATTRLSLRLSDFLIFWRRRYTCWGVYQRPGEEPGISLPGC